MKHEHCCKNSNEDWHIEYDPIGGLWFLSSDLDDVQILFCPFCGVRLEE